MTEYIDRKALIKEVEGLPNCYNGFSDTYDKACIIGLIEEMPSIGERKKGKWLFDEGEFVCSECDGRMVRNVYNFCPWCGADMRSEIAEDTISRCNICDWCSLDDLGSCRYAEDET